MEVKAGYKQTDLGTIPEDWGVVTCRHIVEKIIDNRGKTPPLTASGFPLIEANSISDKSKTPDYSKITKYVSQETYANWFRDGHPKPMDVLLVTVGSAGASCYINESRGSIAQNVIAVRLKKNYLGELFYYYTLSPLFRGQVFAVLMGAVQPSLKVPHLLDFQFPFPRTKAEQEAITSTLSDTDGLIESLEQLIAKKRNIKQGAVQELLRPKEHWVIKRLGDIAHIKTGSRNNEDKDEDGEYPFFVRSATVERINTYSYNCEAILVPGEGGIGSIFHYINGRFEVHQRVYAITQFNSETFSKYIFFYIAEKFGTHALKNTVKATVDSLRLPTFLNFEIVMPPKIGEQAKIASILSDMDAEVAALKEKLTKVRQVKQGMMQELLTGRIRLI